MNPPRLLATTAFHDVSSQGIAPQRLRLSLRRGLMALCLMGVMPLASGSARAADGTYISTVSPGLWSATGNWAGGIVASGAGSTAFFAADITTNPTIVNNDAPRIIGFLSFDDTGSTTDVAWTLANNGVAGNTLALDSGAGGVPSTISLLSLTNDLTISAILAGSNTNNVVFRCPTSGATGSPRTIQVSGANTYTGTTTLSSGILRVNGSILSATNGPLGNSATPIVFGDANTPAITGSSINPANVVLVVSQGFNSTGAAALPVISRDIDSSATPGVAGRNIIRYASLQGDLNAIGRLTVSGNWSLGTAPGRTGYGLLAERFGQNVDFTGAITGGNSTVPFNINDFAGGNTSGIVRLSSANSSFANGISVASGTLLIANNSPAMGNGALGANSTLTVATNGVTAASANPTALIDGAFTVAKTISLDTNGTQAYSYTLGGNTASASSFTGAVNTVGSATNRTLNLSQVAGGTVTFGGVIGANANATGATSLNKSGQGTVVLTGNNVYDGTTRVSNGTLLANNSAGSATGAGAVNVVAATPAVTGQTGSNNNTSGAGANSLQINGISNAVAAGLQVGQSVTASTSTNTLNAAPNTVTSGGALPAGTLITAITVGTTGTNSSTIFISNSFLVPANSTRTFNDLAFGALIGTLGGSGTISGAVSIGAGSTLAPGSASNTTGLLKTGALTLNGSLQADINGAGAGVGYDQVDVAGVVALGGTLSLRSSTSFSVGNQGFILINNDDTDAVMGTFAGLPEDATVFVGSQPYFITYVGGTGNDVVLNNASGGAIISEFRFRGKSGALDEYVELYNKRAEPRNISGWSIQTRTATGLQTTLVPANTIIPPFGRYLFTGSGFSLSPYGTSDQALAADVLDASGVALFNAAGAVQDAVGFTTSDAALKEGAGLPSAPTSDGEYAFVRDTTGTLPKDTSDSTQDFVFVIADADATTPTALATVSGTGGNVMGRLGAPSPEGIADPAYANPIIAGALLDPSVSQSAAPNRERVDFVSGTSLGALLIRRTITNNSGRPITKLRFSVASITSLGTPGPSTQADVRLVSSGNENVTIGGASVPVKGLTLETGAAGQPALPLSGGLGSSAVLGEVSMGTPLANGESRSVVFRLQIVKSGAFSVLFNFHVAPGS